MATNKNNKKKTSSKNTTSKNTKTNNKKTTTTNKVNKSKINEEAQIKQSGLKVILCGIAVTVAIVLFVLLGGSSNVTNNVLRDLNDSVRSLNAYVNKYELPLSGLVEIEANYKGAHGESFPHDFNLNYALEDNILHFSNEDGHTQLELNNDLTELYYAFKKEVKEDIFVVDKETNNGEVITITLNVDKINKYLNKDFTLAELTINKENVTSKEVKDITLTLDDYIITINDKKYKLMYQDKIININILSSGYSININDTFRMNAMFREGIDNYNITDNGYAYSIDITADYFKFVANTQAAIYNSITATFKSGNVSVDKSKEADYTKNPLTRYFTDKN